MDWFQVAISIEQEGETFYRELSEQAGSEGLKQIFSMLADDELEHRKRFEAMQDNTFSVELDSKVMQEAKRVFKRFKTEHFSDEQKHLEVYRKALEVEQKSIDFYRDNLGTLDEGGAHRKALEQIIKEEQAHYRLIDTIVQMVERPESWVEHAEFGLRDEY